ncbi:cobalamin B12-binding domain-containing protein [Sphaerisporangium sp. NPDC051017]|uniref:cobalamin B12-binding domain-containing protein n=1 Tax=Sphaerisporangium sp. NPDC051017 TaxID=3154636 RepID=UPI0034498771
MSGLISVALDLYLERIGEADDQGAVDLVLGLLDDGVPAEDLLLRLVVPAQRRVGELWAANQWSVAREHAATAVSEAAVAAVAVRACPRPTRGRVTVACAYGEYHALPARLLAEVLRLRGWQVDFLGASVPGPHLMTYLHQTGPDLVALSCTLPTRLPRAHSVLTACRSAGMPVLAGGTGFGLDGRYARLLGADVWAPTADAAADNLEAGPLPSFPASPDAPAHVTGEEYTQLLQRRPDLLAGVLDALTRTYPPMASYDARQMERTAEDLGHIADFLCAALYVDDAAMFGEFIAWTCAVLRARGVPAEAVVTGLRILHDRLRDLPRACRSLTEGIRAAQAAARSG